MIVKTYREYVKNKKKYITNLAKEIDLDQIFYRQCYIKNNSLIHIFKKDLLKSKINRNQIQKIYINLGEVRWGKISLLSDFMKYNINISKFGNKFILLGKENYVDINTKKDLNLAKRIFKKK